MFDGKLSLLRDIQVEVSIELGRTHLPLKTVCSLAEEQIVMLDRLTDEPLDLLVNGRKIARGEIVADKGRFGFRVIEMLDDATDTPPLPRGDRVPQVEPNATPADGPKGGPQA